MTKTTEDREKGTKTRKQKMLKSRENGSKAFVTFFNRTCRLIDVIWVNFEGCMQSYTPHGLQPGKRIDLHTYEEHPWVFRDRSTGDKLIFCSNEGKHEEVYFPSSWDGSLDYRAPIINVVLPVYDLKERCLQVVRRLVKKEDVPALGSEIPKSLQEDLLHQKPSKIIWDAPMEQGDEEEE